MALIIPTPDVSSVAGCFREHPLKVLSVSNSRNSCGDALSKYNSNTRVFGLRFCSRIKCSEPRVLNLERNFRPYQQLSSPVKLEVASSPKRSKVEEEKQNYYVNRGYAIRTLREEFPAVFYKELSFDIYRDDVVFKDPINTFVGIENYKSIFWALRFHGRMFFRALWVDIVGIWQPMENMIMVRWTIHGSLRLPWDSHGRFDGTSEYKLDKNGKIFEHRVDNIAFKKPTKFQVLAVNELIQSVGCSSTPKPTFFKMSSSPKMKAPSLKVKFDGFGDYLASVLAVGDGPEAEQSQRT